MVRVLLALLMLPLLCGGAAALGAVAPLVDAAEALEMPALPAAAPTVVARAPEVPVVVQPVVQSLARLAGPVERPATMPLAPTEHDLAAIAAEVAPAPAAPPALATEPFVFPRDAPAPAPAAPEPAMTLAPVAVPVQAASPSTASAALPALDPAPAAALGLLALMALYVGLAPSEALGSPTRRRVHEAILADPGCTAHTIARALGIDDKTARHHLRVLRRAGVVQARRLGALERYFVPGHLPPGGQEAAVALRAPSARALARALRDQGRARAADLARRLDLSEATASVQLRRLQAAGLATRGRDGLWAAA